MLHFPKIATDILYNINCNLALGMRNLACSLEEGKILLVLHLGNWFQASRGREEENFAI